jgi:hypothetical protein
LLGTVAGGSEVLFLRGHDDGGQLRAFILAGSEALFLRGHVMAAQE